jgi:hypothetical protein
MGMERRHRDFPKPSHGFTPLVAAHIPHQGRGRQKLALAWLSWALQREVTLENLDEID